MKIKTKVKTLSFLIFTFMVFTFQYGCEPKDTNPETEEIKSSVTAAIQPEKTKVDSFVITISNGGGFTGLKNGYTLNSAGWVKRWRQLSFVKDTTIWSVKTNGEKNNEFKERLINSGILNKTYNGKGNITFVLSYQTPDTIYTWSWNGRNSEKNIPPEIKDWFNDVTDFIISVKKNR